MQKSTLQGAAFNNKQLIWIMLPLAVVAFYNLMIFNRFFPLTEGWFSTYAALILQGKMPYKDFFLYLPPLYPLTLAGLIKVFGPNFIVLRIFGIFLILGMTTVLYLIFTRFFKPVVAGIASIVAIVYYQSGVAHITYDFTQFMSFYALCAGYCVIKNFDSRDSDKGWIFAFLAGLFAAASFLTKQSNGAFIVIFTFIALLYSTIYTNRVFLLRSILGFGIGSSILVMLILYWLYSNNALKNCYEQIFIGAIQAKGAGHSIFFGWMKIFFTHDFFVACVYTLKVLLVLGYWRFLCGQWAMSNENRTYWAYLLLFFILGLALIVPWYHMAKIEAVTDYFGQRFFQYSMPVGFATTFLILAYGLIKLIRNKKPYPELIIPIISIGLIYGCGTSAGVSEAGIFLGFGLFLCFVLSQKNFFQVGKVFFFFGCFSFLIFLADKKYEEPYYWWYYTTPGVHSADLQSDVPLLKGFYLPVTTLNTIKTVNSIINENSTVHDSILSFPNIPLFYLLNNRFENLKDVVDWPDFLPDNIARNKAQQILKNPPKVIVYLELPESVWSAHEMLFRHNKLSGQREIITAINNLTTNSSRYTLKAVLPINDNVRLKVWTLKHGT